MAVLFSDMVEAFELPKSGDKTAPACSRWSNHEQVVTQYLVTGSEEARQRTSAVANEIATQRVPVSEALIRFWSWVSPLILAGNKSQRSSLVESVGKLQRELGEAFDRCLQQDLQGHLQLASAYAQKIREVNTLLDSLPAFAFLKDAEFRYAAVNRLFGKVLGKPHDEIVTKTDSELFPAAVAARLIKGDRQALKGRKSIRHEENVEFGGKTRTVLFIKAPVLDEDDNPNGLIGVGFDITERKRIEEEHARLAAALESVGDAILTTDTEGTIEFVNPSFERITGYSRTEALGQNPRILKSGYHSAELYRELWETLVRGDVWRGTFRNKRKDGTFFETEQTVSPVRDREGRIESYVGVMRDISERNRLLEAIQHAMMVKSEFTAMVSHELRTPLAAIKEAVDVVADGTAGVVNEHQADFLALAKRNVDRLHRLINDTLDFSKLERGEFRLALEMHDLNALVSEIVEQQRLAAQKMGLRLEPAFDPGLPPVRFDDDRISQVLLNLISNAIRYGGSGRIEVSTERRGDEAVVKVQDSGPGIPGELHEKIFEAFFQLSTGPGRRSGGTGLGLSICRKIMELHGGRIWVESELGRGAAFYFGLHINEQEASQEKCREKVENSHR